MSALSNEDRPVLGSCVNDNDANCPAAQGRRAAQETKAYTDELLIKRLKNVHAVERMAAGLMPDPHFVPNLAEAYQQIGGLFRKKSGFAGLAPRQA